MLWKLELKTLINQKRVINSSVEITKAADTNEVEVAVNGGANEISEVKQPPRNNFVAGNS